MPYHFKDCEYEMRLKKATAAVAARGLDALLMFAPESHYWICGYDTFGFAMFQCLILWRRRKTKFADQGARFTPSTTNVYPQ